MDYLVIDCLNCDVKSRGEVLASQIQFDDLFGHYEKVSLVVCPQCNRAVVVSQYDRNDIEVTEYAWSAPQRVWPSPQRMLSDDIPADVRRSVEEAQKCFRAGAFNACAVMCGRALEAVAHSFGIEKRVLAGGLKDLLSAGVIDKRLYDWGDALRNERNIGAHASGGDVSKRDATDLVEFTNAICEYVFVLTARFEKFTERKKKPEVGEASPLHQGKQGKDATTFEGEIPF